ncbi:MFS transporter [Oryzobacter telluris]|uniref:MFS transporter n=1 Tax=Oryzobacter telluris TaxID=3149179 RepID=UPI00370DB3F6
MSTGVVPARSDRLFLPASALLWGVQFAFLNPAIGIILVTLYDATPGQVGVALAAYNVSGFVSTLVVPTRADRSGDYLRPMLWCGVFTVLLVTALALATTLPMAVVALVALGGPAGVGIGLLFAHQRSTGATVRDVMRVRAVFSFAWVAGPPLAAFLMGLLGNRSILWAIAAVALVSFGVTTAMIRERSRAALEAESAVAVPAVGDRMLDAVRRPEVGLLLLAFVLLGAAGNAAVSTLPLLVTERLGLSLVWGGVALGTAAALEIPVLVALGRMSGRFGPRRIIAAGCVAGVAYYLAMTVVGGPVALVAVQVLNALFVAVTSGVGLTLVQEVVGRPGLASGLFMNTTRVGAVLAGPVVAVAGVPALGYPGVFGACALLVAVGLGVLVLEYLLRRPQPDRPARSRSRST